MSHLADFKTQVTDRDALVRALERMGFKGKVEVHDTAVVMDSYAREGKKANVIVRKVHNGSLSDIGFEQQKNGTYTALIDTWGGTYNQTWQNKLFTHYNVEKSKMEFESRGFKSVEGKDDAGRITLEVKFVKQSTEPGKIAVNI
jgi:hypothetical protein